MSQFFTSGGQSIGVSASVSVLPKNIQDWFPLGLGMAITVYFLLNIERLFCLSRWKATGPAKDAPEVSTSKASFTWMW